MRMRKLVTYVFTILLCKFVFGNYEDAIEFYAEEQIYVTEDEQIDFTSEVKYSSNGDIPSVHTDPRNILVNQLFNPDFTESDVIVPILEVDSEETDEESQSETHDIELIDTEENVVEDFTHTKGNWMEILSIEPTFSESEDVVENINGFQEPKYEENTIFEDETDNDYPSNDIFKDVVDPSFTENEFVPNRIFDGDVGSIPSDQNQSKSNEDKTDYKNPNSKYEKTKQVSPALEDDTEPEKITLEIPNISDTFVKNWEYINDLDNGWYELEWFGFFYTAEDDFKGTGWIYHMELGWIFISSKNYDSVWIWSEQFDGWKWTSETTYPYLFLNDTKSWFYYNKDRKIFYNYAEDKWFDTSIK